MNRRHTSYVPMVLIGVIMAITFGWLFAQMVNVSVAQDQALTQAKLERAVPQVPYPSQTILIEEIQIHPSELPSSPDLTYTGSSTLALRCPETREVRTFVASRTPLSDALESCKDADSQVSGVVSQP